MGPPECCNDIGASLSQNRSLPTSTWHLLPTPSFCVDAIDGAHQRQLVTQHFPFNKLLCSAPHQQRLGPHTATSPILSEP